MTTPVEVVTSVVGVLQVLGIDRGLNVNSYFRTLEYDIRDYLAGNHAAEDMGPSDATARHVITLAKNVANHTLDMVSHGPSKVKDYSDRTIRMSELGTPCHRQLFYKWYHPTLGMYPMAEPPAAMLPVKFTYGDYIEELVLFLAAESGHTVSKRQEKVTLTSEFTEWYAVGHIDAVIDEYVVDVKSAADMSFKKYQREGLTEENDMFGYLYQIDAYASALKNPARALVFTNKHDGNLHIVDRVGQPFMPVTSMIKAIGHKAELFLDHGKLPDRLPTKATKYGNQLGTVCSYCAFKHSCYDGAIKGFIDKSRPVYLDEETITKEGYAYIETKTGIAKPLGWREEETAEAEV
jgi:hypothetical protein